MRKYTNEQILETIVCNCCGKETIVERGLLKEDFVSIDKKWGYFSHKDGEIHSLDLCESCYDEFCKSLKTQPTITQNNEL